MELGISTLLWYDEPDLLPHLPLLAAEGIRHIEIRRIPEHFPYADSAALQRLRAALGDCGIKPRTLHVPDPLIVAMSALDEQGRAEALAETKRIAAAFSQLGGRILVTHCGGLLADETERPLQFVAGQDSIAQLAAFCRELGLPVAVENSLPTKPRLGDTVAEVVRLVEGIGADGIGYCLDTSHANIGGDPVAALDLVGPGLLTLHISDNDGKSDQHALPFEGTVDWPAFMAALEATGYDGVFMMEVRATREPKQMLREARLCFERLMQMYEGG